MASKLKVQTQAYRARLEKHSADRRIDEKDVSDVIDDARAHKLSQEQALLLASWAERNQSLFEYGQEKRLHRFLREEVPGLTEIPPEVGVATTFDGSNPAVQPKDAGTVEYRNLGWSVGLDQPVFHDNTQKVLGDCWLQSTISAVAQRHPELIRRAVQPLGNGKFIVHLYEWKSWDEPPTRVEVPISEEVPVDETGKPLYSSSELKKLYPLLIQKAYAQWRGGYEYLTGGNAANALAALTGERPQLMQVFSDAKCDEVYAQLERLFRAQSCVVASSYYADRVPGIIDGHAYTVLGVRKVGYQQRVLLRNPHSGSKERPIELSIDQFVRAFHLVEWVTPPAPWKNAARAP